MSLRFLLDEHLDPEVARQVQAHHPAIEIQSVLFWRGGALVGKHDLLLLAAAAEAGWTLVTYDQKTIPRWLQERALRQEAHSGVVFVDTRSLPPEQTGRLVRALVALWEQGQAWEWTDRVAFLRPTG